MWNIPLIVGQKVTLDPSYSHYSDFNRTQSKGRDGYILSIEGMTLSRWFLGTRSPSALVVWENGHVNSYEMKALLPIDSFKTIERVEFKSGQFQNVFNETGRNYIAERVIMKNDDVKHYSMFDKEKRLDILRKAEATFQTLDESDQNKESVQMKYMSILEEIERTKRAEEVTLFLESEGDDVSTPKKHQEVAQSQCPGEATRNSDRSIGTGAVGWVDADFLNPCAELPLNNCMTINSQPGEVVTLTGRSAQGRSIYDISEEEFRANLSPYMEQIQRLGAESRVREDAHTMNQGISDFERLVASLNATTEEGRRNAPVPWWEANDND